jgi:hypothetical protein
MIKALYVITLFIIACMLCMGLVPGLTPAEFSALNAAAKLLVIAWVVNLVLFIIFA